MSGRFLQSQRWTSASVLMGVGIVMIVVAAVIITFNLLTVPAPSVSPTVQPPTLKVSYPTVMPEDLGRLESEIYDICKEYANLDLSGMVNLCKRVGFQE